MYENYDDCENKCKYTFGKNKACLKCDYYNYCMVEEEIKEMELKHDKALNKLLSRIEDGEHI